MNNIEELIKRLKEQGVEAGKNEAEQIIADAKQKAYFITQEAEQKAAAIIEKTNKEKKEIEIATKSALELAAKTMIHSTAIKISELLDIVLKEKIKEQITSDETVKKLIKGEKIDIEDLLHLLRENIAYHGAEIEYSEGSIKISQKDKNFHYEISSESIAESYKSYIREELHELLFPAKR